jgi:hypothetical protein
MNGFLWKDITIIKRSKGSFILSIIIGFVIALSSFLSGVNSGEPGFCQSFLNLLLLLPLVVGFNFNQKLFLMEVGERSIESVLAMPISVRRILVDKSALVTFLSLLLGWIILLISTLLSWAFVYHHIIIPPMESLLVLFAAIIFTFSISGLVCVACWIFPNISIITVIYMLIFIVAVLFINLSPLLLSFSPHSMGIAILALSLVLTAVFYTAIKKVKKEKVALARL